MRYAEALVPVFAYSVTTLGAILILWDRSFSKKCNEIFRAGVELSKIGLGVVILAVALQFKVEPFSSSWFGHSDNPPLLAIVLAFGVLLAFLTSFLLFDKTPLSPPRSSWIERPRLKWLAKVAISQGLGLLSWLGVTYTIL